MESGQRLENETSIRGAWGPAGLGAGRGWEKALGERWEWETDCECEREVAGGCGFGRVEARKSSTCASRRALLCSLSCEKSLPRHFLNDLEESRPVNDPCSGMPATMLMLDSGTAI